MTQEEIIEYNKLCAEFLGWDYNKFMDRWNEKDFHHENSHTYTIDLKFHSDWNWTMEILDKIEEDFHTVISQGITGHYININREDVNVMTQSLDNPSKFMGNGRTKKEAVVKAIHKFLKWYKNEQRT